MQTKQWRATVARGAALLEEGEAGTWQDASLALRSIISRHFDTAIDSNDPVQIEQMIEVDTDHIANAASEQAWSGVAGDYTYQIVEAA